MILEFETRHRRIGRVSQRRRNSTKSKPISLKKGPNPLTSKNNAKTLDRKGELLDKTKIPDQGANNGIGMKVIHFAKKKSALCN